MPSLWRGNICGWRWKVFHCPQLTQIFRNSRSLCIIHLQIPSVMPLEMRKVQARIWGDPKRGALADRPSRKYTPIQRSLLRQNAAVGPLALPEEVLRTASA